MKVLGREPVIWTTAVAAIVQFISAFFIPVTADQQGVIAAVAIAVLGFIGAVQLHDGTWAQAFVVVVKALVALAVAFGLHWAPDQQMIFMGLVQAVLALFVRSQVTAPVDAAGRDIGARAL